MRLFERIRVRREARQDFEEAIAAGKTVEEAVEIAEEKAKERARKMGLDWSTVLPIFFEFILALLEAWARSKQSS